MPYDGTKLPDETELAQGDIAAGYWFGIETPTTQKFDADGLVWAQADNAESISIVNAAAKNFSVSYTGGSQTEIQSGASFGFVGTRSNHPLRFIVNNAYKAEINASGIFSVPAIFGNDLNGLTFRDTKTKDDGELGYDSSTDREKTDITDYSNSAWIHQARVVEYTPKSNLNIRRVGMIAEEIEKLEPRVTFRETYEEKAGQLIPISLNTHENWLELKRAGGKVKEKAIAKKITGTKLDSKTGETILETIDEEIEIISKVQGINQTEIIPFLILEIQSLKKELIAIKAGLG